MNKLVDLLLRGYQFFLSPWLGQNCRFSPSCSQYARECFKKFSFIRALWYTFRRIIKCHPYHPGGHDPSP